MKEPKNNTSYLTLTLSDDIINQWKRYREWQHSKIEWLGDFYQDNGWIFTQVDGKRCHPSYFTHEIPRLGLSDYNEYLYYLEFKRLKEIRKAPR